MEKWEAREQPPLDSLRPGKPQRVGRILVEQLELKVQAATKEVYSCEVIVGELRSETEVGYLWQPLSLGSPEDESLLPLPVSCWPRVLPR